MKFALIHSPLVGPSTWRWTADSLLAAGHDVVVPDLRDAAQTGRPDAVIGAAAAAIPSEWRTLALVAHSGAGALLPSLADQLVRCTATNLVFVDAGLPACDGRTTPSGDFLHQLRELAVDGVLPKWSTWWGEEVMAMLVPIVERRIKLEAEMIEIPLRFYESPLETPHGWCERPAAFLLLSESYRDDLGRAQKLGWHTRERFGGHLDIVNDADEVARLIVELID